MTTHEIKRYTVSGDIAYPIHEDPEGDYVTYLDHVAAIEADRQHRGEPIGYIMPTAIKQLKAGGNAIVGGLSQGGDVAVYLAPQPAENSVNLEVAIQAISALHSNDTDWDTSYWNQAVGRCVSELNKLRSQQPAEPVTCFKCGPSCQDTGDACRYADPVKVLSKDEIRAIMLKHGYTVKPGHDDLKPYVYAAARELIALAQGREQ